jgi:signal transduction histidine kinase
VDLHTLSHRLHSSTIESLGLVPALTALCKEFTTQQGVAVHLAPDDIPRSVHHDTSLCVFRIVQEALRNVKKYSGATQAEVELQMAGNKLEITVRDLGCGFDLADLHFREGLGVRSMEERARLSGGGSRFIRKAGVAPLSQPPCRSNLQQGVPLHKLADE